MATRQLVIYVPDHSFDLDSADDRVVDAFLDWFRTAGPDDVHEVDSGERYSVFVQKRNITQVRVLTRGAAG
ncbi:hypothetical protein [Modestobacter sp. NPDC049651]|uniref:hypothetical protein n=1 Tax=unclassified Modestobacter TaxID=2643866 RepID=UPI00340DD8AD